MEPVDIYLHEQAGKSNWINEIHNHHIYLPLRGTPFSGYLWFRCIMIVTSTYFPVSCFLLKYLPFIFLFPSFSLDSYHLCRWWWSRCVNLAFRFGQFWSLSWIDNQVGFLRKFKYQITIGAGARCRHGDQGYCHIQVDWKWNIIEKSWEFSIESEEWNFWYRLKSNVFYEKICLGTEFSF